jgi:hypothetical protein
MLLQLELYEKPLKRADYTASIKIAAVLVFGYFHGRAWRSNHVAEFFTLFAETL